MIEYISKQDVINITAETGAWETQNRVRELPAANVKPVRCGRWENEYLEDDIWWAECSSCKQETHSKYVRPSTYRYCSNCGARMNGDKE